MRRLLIFASTLVLFDVTFYSAIAPLLPDYVDDLGLTKAEAGVLSAAYAAGTLIAALPGGFLASRLGPRRTVIIGLTMLGAASVVFGFAQQIVLLDVARFAQGVAGALMWSGALAWLIMSAPPERRGAVIGTALGTAVAGALIGPALGALAGAVGTEVVFSAVVAIAAAFAFAAMRIPEPAESERQSLGEMRAAIATRPVLTSTAFVAAPSMMFGAIEVLVPLRMDDFGAGPALIAAAFIACAAIEAVLSPLSGRYSDRGGRRIPFVVGLALTSLTMVVFAVAVSNALVFVSLLISAVGAAICFTPALTMLSESAEAANLHQGLAAGLSNVAWASGQVVGGLAGGGVADVAGYAAPSLAIAIVLAAVAVYATRCRLPTTVAASAPG